MKLVIFDGDETLWYGLDGGNVSDNGDCDYVGSNDYEFACPPAGNPDIIVRNDGKRLQLFPETRAVLRELGNRDVLIALCTYNHPQPTYSALAAWKLTDRFDHIEAAWSPDKEHMLRNVLRATGIGPIDAIFVDDDPGRGHREQAERVGIRFLKRGSDITDLNQVLAMVAPDEPEELINPLIERTVAR